MKMKIKLYIGYIIVFTFVFSQVAFPLSAKVSNINVVEADSSESLPVFNMLASDEAKDRRYTREYLVKDVVLKDAKDYHFLEYEINLESTSILPLDIIDSKLLADEKYKDRIIVRLIEPYDKVVSTVRKASNKFKILVDTSGLTEEEIHEMVESISIHVNWKSVTGLKRENRVYLPEDTLSLLVLN